MNDLDALAQSALIGLLAGRRDGDDERRAPSFWARYAYSVALAMIDESAAQAPPEPTSEDHTVVGQRYRFDYPADFKNLPDYTAHAGQVVTVLRRLGPEEADVPMYRISAMDGWEGDADADELNPDWRWEARR